MYYLVEKIKSKVWIKAGINEGNCLAGAERLFYGLGYDTHQTRVTWGEDVKRQKNYGGQVADYKEFNLSEYDGDFIYTMTYLDDYSSLYDSRERAYAKILENWQDDPERIELLKQVYQLTKGVKQ